MRTSYGRAAADGWPLPERRVPTMAASADDAEDDDEDDDSDGELPSRQRLDGRIQHSARDGGSQPSRPFSRTQPRAHRRRSIVSARQRGQKRWSGPPV